ncbi:MAG: hypothetical protein R3344_00535 [Acidobacteriota bacterium]|nr:hypothetical protein [Acidobacteriota bacterium]
MNKTAAKKEEARRETVSPAREAMQTAYEIHTLAHMLYGEFAAAYPWVAPVQPMWTYDPAPRFGTPGEIPGLHAMWHTPAVGPGEVPYVSPFFGFGGFPR